jgi:archaellum component FlaC
MSTTNYTPFTFWCQKVLPLVYDDALSYYEVLGKTVDYLNNVMKDMNSFTAMVEAQGQSVVALQSEMNEVQNELEKVKNGNYVSLYLDSLTNWIDENLKSLVSNIVKYVAFELDETGHLIANIPSTWDFLQFDTVIDTNDTNYGRLVLQW